MFSFFKNLFNLPKQTTPSCTQQLTDPGQSVKPAKQYRCILQGAQESGKSTFVKHFLSLKKEDPRQVLLDQEEHKQQIAVIIHSAINTLCEQLSTKELESMGKNPELLNAMHRVQMIKTVSLDALFENADDIKALWECNGIQACYNRRNEFQFEDNYFASNFVSQVHKFMDTSYLLTDEDIQTIYPDRWTGIKECSGVVENVTLIDLGGRRSERRKWIHCFEDLSFILFLAAVSEYDQVLEEDGKTNRLEESLHLFKTLLVSGSFVETEFILLLTKTDLLKEKLRGGQSPFKKHFPTMNSPFPRWEGDDDDYEGILAYIENLYKRQDQQDDGNKGSHKIHCISVNLADTEDFQRIFPDLENILLKRVTKDNKT